MEQTRLDSVHLDLLNFSYQLALTPRSWRNKACSNTLHMLAPLTLTYQACLSEWRIRDRMGGRIKVNFGPSRHRLSEWYLASCLERVSYRAIPVMTVLGTSIHVVVYMPCYRTSDPYRCLRLLNVDS